MVLTVEYREQINTIRLNQGAPFKDVPGKYRVRFSGGTTLGQCACLYV